jgi:cysteine desulfurase
MVYLDYSANTPVDGRVISYMNELLVNYVGNANSTYKIGQESKKKLDDMTFNIAKLLNVDLNTYDIIYVSSATEANNLAIKGVAECYSAFGKHIIASAVEHPSINGTLSYLQGKGYSVSLVGVDQYCKLNIDELKSLIRKDTILVCITYVEGETGTIQPIKEIVELLKDYPNCHLLVDATQAVGKIPLELSGVDMFTFAPHKFYGITGVGALFKKKSIIVTPLIHGGSSYSLYRSGTMPLALIGSLEKALELAINEFDIRFNDVKKKNEYLRSKLNQIKGITYFSFDVNNPFILNIALKNYKAKEIVEYLDSNDIYVSAKSACSITQTPSKTIFAMTHNKLLAFSSFRISLSHLTTYEELDYFIDVLYKKVGK